MKKFFQLSILALTLGLLNTGCNDSFLEIIPPDAIPEDQFLASAKDLRQVLNGSYDALTYSGAYGGMSWFISDLMADHVSELSAKGNLDWNAHYTRTTDNFLGTTRGMMTDFGKTIGRANYVLDRLDKFEMTQDEKNKMKGEALFLRAVAHFELVRHFAQPYGYTGDNSHLGVAIHLKYSPDALDRSTVKQVYDQVIADLNEAVTLLPASNPATSVPVGAATNPQWANAMAAKGFLAKVYFQMNDFSNCLKNINDITSSGMFTFDDSLFTDSLHARFSKFGTTEAVFALTSVDFGSDNSGGTIRNIYSKGNLQGGKLSEYIAQRMTIEPNDKRGKKWVNGNILTKFLDRDVQTQMQVTVLHLTELMLMKAECMAEGDGDLTEAAALINKINVRAGVPQISTLSKSIVIAEARKQRELEMVGEGNRFHELKRQAVRDNPNLLIRGSIWNCNGMVNQIPDNELTGNPNMKPNPVGGC
ncbi:MAG: RagB/SusD family nutrient uptake outer membrane protein [Bacteroidia bacterium]